MLIVVAVVFTIFLIADGLRTILRGEYTFQKLVIQGISAKVIGWSYLISGIIIVISLVELALSGRSSLLCLLGLGILWLGAIAAGFLNSVQKSE
jgi:hypothetical protein